MRLRRIRRDISSVGNRIGESGCGEKLRDFLDEPLAGRAFFEGTLPDGYDMPAEVAEGNLIFEIPCLVAFDLGFPKDAAGFREAECGTVFMAVPEAAVDEDDGVVFRQDEIGFAGQGFVIRPIDRKAVAETVEHRAQGEFRLGVAAADAGHDFRALLRSEDVHGGRLKT